MNAELTEGDLVQLIDNKGRRYQGVLTAGKEFHFHSGIIGHDELIGIAEGSVVLDLPEPWQVVPHAAKAMRAGGIFCAYTPSIVQVTQLRDALAESGFFAAESLEVMNRGWHIEGMAVRPDHRMVAHTGFLTHARLGAG